MCEYLSVYVCDMCVCEYVYVSVCIRVCVCVCTCKPQPILMWRLENSALSFHIMGSWIAVRIWAWGKKPAWEGMATAWVFGIKATELPEATWNHVKRVFKERHGLGRPLTLHPGHDLQHHKETKNSRRHRVASMRPSEPSAGVALWTACANEEMAVENLRAVSPHFSWA